jgi:hypothetical protein
MSGLFHLIQSYQAGESCCVLHSFTSCQPARHPVVASACSGHGYLGEYVPAHPCRHSLNATAGKRLV